MLKTFLFGLYLMTLSFVTWNFFFGAVRQADGQIGGEYQMFTAPLLVGVWGVTISIVMLLTIRKLKASFK